MVRCTIVRASVMALRFASNERCASRRSIISRSGLRFGSARSRPRPRPDVRARSAWRRPTDRSRPERPARSRSRARGRAGSALDHPDQALEVLLAQVARRIIGRIGVGDVLPENGLPLAQPRHAGGEQLEQSSLGRHHGDAPAPGPCGHDHAARLHSSARPLQARITAVNKPLSRHVGHATSWLAGGGQRCSI
jgi:hypothetical protein